MFSVLVLAMAAATSTIRPAHAAGSLFIGLSRTSQLSIGSTFTVEVNVSSIDLFDTWDISVQTNPNVITPTLITTAGDIFGAPTEFVNCVNGVGIGCVQTDTVGIAHSAATSPSGLPVSGNGLLFNITYTVVGAGYSDISFPPFTYASQILYVGNLVVHSTFNGVYGISPFDYSLSNNGPVSVMQGGSSPVTITARLTAAAAAPAVALSCAALTLPSGISCGGSTLTPSLTGAMSDLLVTAAPTLAKGSYTVQVTGSPAGATAFAAVTNATVTVVAPFDYVLSNNGPVSIQAGSSSHATITATLKTGTASPVRLSCVGSSLPSGITCGSFTVNPVTPASAGATSDLTVNVASSVTPGSYTFKVTGSPLGPTTTPTTVGVTVTPVPFDYSLSNNGPVSITQGSSGHVTITATLKAGVTQSVTLSCAPPLPSGITCASFSPPSVTPTLTGATSDLTISVDSSVAIGSYSVMVTGSPPGTTTTPTTVTVDVLAPFDYSLSNNGPVSIEAGSSGPVTITATLTAGTAVPVTLKCVTSTLPSGITCGSFTVNPVTPTMGGAASVLTVNVASSVTPGSYPIQVTGSPLGPSTTPTTVSVTVTPVPFDYSLTNSGPVSIQAGSSGPVTITATLTAGTAVPVTLKCVSSTLPAGVYCSFATNPVTPTSAGVTSVLTISTSSSTPVGTITLSVTGSPLGATTTPTSVSVTVTSPPFDYSLSNSGTLSIQAGSSGTVTITATLTAGTANSVTLSCVSSSLPSGISCGSFSVNPLIPTSTGATTVLTLSVASSVAASSYSFQITASPLGPTTSPTSVRVTVTAPAASASPILGLSPSAFYSIVGVVVIIIVALTVLALRRRGRTP